MKSCARVAGTNSKRATQNSEFDDLLSRSALLESVRQEPGRSEGTQSGPRPDEVPTQEEIE